MILPAKSFTPAARGGPGATDVYGVASLRGPAKEEARIETLLAVRAARIFEKCSARSFPAAVVALMTPAPEVSFLL